MTAVRSDAGGAGAHRARSRRHRRIYRARNEIVSVGVFQAEPVRLLVIGEQLGIAPQDTTVLSVSSA